MLKFNNTHIFTGYLKQLLSSFKLPTYKIYSLKHQNFKDHLDENGIETDVIPSTPSKFVPYLKDGCLQIYSKNEEGGTFSWQRVAQNYSHNQNNFKSYVISNNIYDSYTHQYLGDFLRYQRDANNLDLMCLYNCFNNEMPAILSYKKDTIDFNTDSTKYKIYMIPVKYLEKYTIAIDCSSRVEMFCGFYNKYFISPIGDWTTTLENFIKATYQSYNSLRFNDPILYDKLNSSRVLQLLAEYYNSSGSSSPIFNFINFEEDLKLFIKIPYSNNSSIVILEGDYRGWNDRQYRMNYSEWNDSAHQWELKNNWKQISNKFIVNFEGYEDRLAENTAVFKPITNLQLLQFNTGISYPFADRLIEYLIGNVITGEDDLEDNIKRIQKVINCNNKNYTATNNFYGLWDEYIRPVLYSYMQSNATSSAVNHDLLGYVDKDTENNYKSVSTIRNKTIATLKDIDLYDEIYLAAKAKEIKRGY